MMGGFTINGCGVGDSYYPLKTVGVFMCSSCKKEQTFSLMELKRKIKVFFIPTVSLYSKYAIVCEKCKNGYYVEESVKDDIIALRTIVTDITPEGVKFLETGKIKASTEVEEKKDIAVVQNERSAPEESKAIPEQIKTEKKSDSTIIGVDTPQISHCPECGFSYVANPMFCPSCGKQLR